MTTWRAPLPRLSPARRALVGAVWVLAWTAAWAGALMLFPAGARAASLARAVSAGPVSLERAAARGGDLPPAGPRTAALDRRLVP